MGEGGTKIVDDDKLTNRLPLVRTHPSTGRKCIWVTPRFMESIEGLSVDESRELVSRHDIAGIWVAFFSRCQRHRCPQVSQCMVPGTSPENAIVHKCTCSRSLLRLSPNCSSLSSSPEASKRSGCLYRLGW